MSYQVFYKLNPNWVHTIGDRFEHMMDIATEADLEKAGYVKREKLEPSYYEGMFFCKKCDAYISEDNLSDMEKDEIYKFCIGCGSEINWREVGKLQKETEAGE